MIANAPNINALWAGLLVEELLRNGVEAFVISPGSRSTPLTAALGIEPRAKKFVHFDERGAAYFALGHARATRCPVALICTSGTAVANYYPAVVEASMSQVPLIVITADRPPELLDTGANQTIDQTRFFGVYARWYAALPCPEATVAPEVVLTTVDQAVYRATHGQAGPVHINCAFREPLAPVKSAEVFGAYLKSVEPWLSGNAPFTTYMNGEPAMHADTQRDALKLLQQAERGLLLVGQLASPKETGSVLKLAKALRWPVFADIASGLRMDDTSNVVVHWLDLALASKRANETLRPDVVLQIGGAVTSKRLAQFLAAHPPVAHVRVAEHPLRHDPAHNTTVRVQANVETFCNWLSAAQNKHADSPWLLGMRAIGEEVGKAVTARLMIREDITEPGIAWTLSKRAPAKSVLFAGNSMPIRDMDMFSAPRHDDIFVVANRGASGIDGNIATAAGLAHGLDKTVTAVIGDLAALHDLNSLTLLKDTPEPVVLVIVNNNGGGIFHFLPIADHEAVFEPYFGTPHGFAFQHVATMMGLGYSRPKSLKDFAAAYEHALELGNSSIIEVSTDRRENRAVHEALLDAARAALDGK
ncbi:MAG: 2-succinyl-5-enolpyruvyl-6-hydroxy-3-cyclohexene-1-carboxylic-acid synthase [Candidatus Hydrogenedentes bacterium]|nr:2-succinyl-5-enolpyruvyl-6-hydroxy-3-cyclohexene-1-carboxylic-acid synthase [Candidatus Hydrogenedentota bacterium]